MNIIYEFKRNQYKKQFVHPNRSSPSPHIPSLMIARKHYFLLEEMEEEPAAASNIPVRTLPFASCGTNTVEMLGLLPSSLSVSKYWVTNTMSITSFALAPGEENQSDERNNSEEKEFDSEKNNEEKEEETKKKRKWKRKREGCNLRCRLRSGVRYRGVRQRWQGVGGRYLHQPRPYSPHQLCVCV
jgi:hypothetical protein